MMSRWWRLDDWYRGCRAFGYSRRVSLAVACAGVFWQAAYRLGAREKVES